MSVQAAMFNPMLNNYLGYTGLCDTLGYDSLGMNGGIFGCMPIGFGGGYGGNYDYSQYYNNYYNQMTDYLNFNSRYNLQAVQNQRYNDITINGPDAGITKQLKVLQEKILTNEQEQIQSALSAYVQAVRAKYPDASDDDVRNYASMLYGQLTGHSITDDIRSYGSSSFWQGFKQVASLGIANKVTAEENISQITGQPVSRSENFGKIAGRAAGGAALGALGLFAGWVGVCTMAVGALIGGLSCIKKHGS